MQMKTNALLLRYQTFMKTSVDGIHILDMQGNIIEFNDAFCLMLGYTKKEMAELNARDWVVEFSGEELLARLHGHIGKSVLIETKHRRKDNELIDVEICIAGEEIDGQGWIFCSSRDVTERKRQEQNLRALSLHQQTVRDEEKARFAREVHDELGSTVAGIMMDTYWLSSKLASMQGTEPLQKRAKSIVGNLGSVVKASRRIITDMHPSILDELGLYAAVESYCDEFQGLTGIECKVVSTENEDWQHLLDKTQAINLFRILQEALTNTARHSGASKVKVELKYVNGAVSLSVNDNGCGLTEGNAVPPTCYGIRNMRERIGLMGGKVNFNTSIVGGLSVTVDLPLSSNNQGSK